MILAIYNIFNNDTSAQMMDEDTLNLTNYIDSMALLLDLQLKPEHRPGVVKNFARIEAIAQLVNEFSLPDNIEAAPIFEP